MQIKKVTFSKQESYEPNPGRWIAKVEFESRNGNCDIPLSSEVSEKLLQVLTPFIVEFAQRSTTQIAEILTKQLADAQTPAIEA
jgi:hypothetical protein